MILLSCSIWCRCQDVCILSVNIGILCLCIFMSTYCLVSLILHSTRTHLWRSAWRFKIKIKCHLYPDNHLIYISQWTLPIKFSIVCEYTFFKYGLQDFKNMSANGTLTFWCKQFLINHWTNLKETWRLLYPV